MNLEVFVLGGQRIDQKGKGRREKIKKGSRERRDTEKRDKRELSCQFEEEEEHKPLPACSSRHCYS